jgi:hypothetical protein
VKIRYALVTAGMVSALAAAPAFAQADNVLAQADNTNSRWSPSTFDTWMQRDYSVYYNDRAAREAYMAQEQRRREAIERHELARAPLQDQDYDSAPNPTRVERGTSATNPTGNELRGQNSGGK